MRAWLIVLTVLVVAVMLGLVGLAAGVAVLHPDEQRATRARAVLRILLVFLAATAGAAVLRLQQLGVLPP